MYKRCSFALQYLVSKIMESFDGGLMLNDLNEMNINAIECELSIYRKGCISVHINLLKKYLTWRESRQWCNDFTRSISPELIASLRKFMTGSDLFKTMVPAQESGVITGSICSLSDSPDSDQSDTDYSNQNKSSWQINLIMDANVLSRTGHLPLPDGWHDFQRIIEKISKVPFRLS